MTSQRFIPNFCSDQLVSGRDFYVNLLGFEVAFEGDWYLQPPTDAVYGQQCWLITAPNGLLLAISTPVAR